MAATLPLSLDIAKLERVVLRPDHPLTDQEFLDFCAEHTPLRIEKNADGEIIIMSPLGGESGLVHSEVTFELKVWAKSDGRGIAVAGETGITLPDGSVFAPDVFWVPHDLWKSAPNRKAFPALVPPFVIEVRSPTDHKKDLHNKMRTYLRNGVELGWLIDPLSKTVAIYRAGEAAPVELDDPAQVTGEGPVDGFVLNLQRVYSQI